VDQFITDLWERHSTGILNIGRGLLITIAIIAGGRVIAFLGDRLIHKAGVEKFKLDETIASILKMIVKYGTFVVCVIMILENFGFNTTSLIALLGATGVAVGLALKDTLSNIASGIIILFLHPFRKGDFIEFGAFMGLVKEINLFSTVLETIDGVNVSAPNSCIWNAPLKNYSRNPRRRMELSVRISYADSIDAAFNVFRQIAAEEKRFLPDPAPQIMVQSMGDFGVTILMRAWASSDVYWDVYWDQMRNVKERIEEAGLSIPIPHREIKVVN
jgi:small conductance mechanosensitive channel